MRKVLIVTSVASMILQFNMDNIRLLQELGCSVDVACNFHDGNTCPQDEVDRLRSLLEQRHVGCHQIPFARDIKKVRQNAAAARLLSRLVKAGRYDMVHCQSPIGGLLGRFVCIGRHTKAVYTVHGFHFYKGAPKKNWLLYFPVEWACSWFTDTLIAINREDYLFAKKHLHAKGTVYIPGVGIDTERFRQAGMDESVRAKARQQFDIKEHEVLLLSVGELSIRKNHKVILDALSRIGAPNIRYLIAGIGGQGEALRVDAAARGLSDRVALPGYLPDVWTLYAAADVFVFPSLQEGLPVALIEAAAAGLPCVVSDIRGNRDIVHSGLSDCFTAPFDDAEAFAGQILAALSRGKGSAKDSVAAGGNVENAGAKTSAAAGTDRECHETESVQPGCAAIPPRTGNAAAVRKQFDRAVIRKKMNLLYQRILGMDL